jgi:hypothetical protein
MRISPGSTLGNLLKLVDIGIAFWAVAAAGWCILNFQYLGGHTANYIPWAHKCDQVTTTFFTPSTIMEEKAEMPTPRIQDGTCKTVPLRIITEGSASIRAV